MRLPELGTWEGAWSEPALHHTASSALVCFRGAGQQKLRH